MDAPLAVLLSALLVCSCSLPTNREPPREHESAFEKVASVAKDSTTPRGGSIRPADADASSEGWLDSYRKRSAGSDTSLIRWDGGLIPYVVDNDVPRDKILLAMAHWHNRTCIRFVPRTNEGVYVRIQLHPTYCNSMIGKVAYLTALRGYSGQPFQLTPACVNSTGSIIHELGHVVGLVHEQCRSDRDAYVTVLWNNVKPSLVSDFAIVTLQYDTSSYGPYDFGSIMHYSLNANSINGSNTLEPKVPYEGVIGQREGLSTLDVLKVNRMYGCPADPTPTVQPSSSYAEGPSPSVTMATTSTSISNDAQPDVLSTPVTSSAVMTSRVISSWSTPSSSSSYSSSSSIATASLGITSSRVVSIRPTATPITTATPTSSSSASGPTANGSTVIDPNSVLSGSNIALKVYATPNNNFLWVGCTATSCAVRNCPGNRFKPEKVALCPEYIFIISRTDGGRVIRVGDLVSLTQLGGSTLFCGQANPACMMSPNCRDLYGQFSFALCDSQVLVVRAENKGFGQPITNNDNIVLDYWAGSVPLTGWTDTLFCHPEAGSTCERRYCFDPTLSLQGGNTTASTLSSCRQFFTLFKIS